VQEEIFVGAAHLEKYPFRLRGHYTLRAIVDVSNTFESKKSPKNI